MNRESNFSPAICRLVRLCKALPVLAVVLAAGASTVFGCFWTYVTDHSVRFNGYRAAAELSRLPPLPKYETADKNKLFSWDAEDDPESEGEYARIKKIDELWDDITKGELEGRQPASERAQLQDYLERTSNQHCSRWGSAVDAQRRRNSAVDKLDALESLDRGAPVSAVQAYLRARSAYDAGRPAADVIAQLGPAESDRRLQGNSAYLRAALLFRDSDAKAASAFADLAAKYPHSNKREGAVYMAALARMKESACANPHPAGQRLNREGDIEALVKRLPAARLAPEGSTEPGRSKPIAEPESAVERCRDAAWLEARAGFERLLREYPGGRYYWDGRGWLAHLSLVAGDRVSALVAYYQMLGSHDPEARVEAVFSLGLIRRHTDDSEMKAVENRLEAEPAAALAYAYHSIYNVAAFTMKDRWWESLRKEGDHSTDGELKRVAEFATRLMRRYPRAAVDGAFAVRVAEADLELGDIAAAEALARRALGMGVKQDIRAEALWVLGIAQYRRGEQKAARQTLSTLAAENPNNRYTEGARAHLAMLLEDMGDMNGALEQYLALDYRFDAAYFVDVLMPTDQLAGFVDAHRETPQHNDLLYGLGVRYLRDGRWDDARRVLERVRTLDRRADEDYRYNLHRYDRADETPREPPKDECDPKVKGIRRQWVDQDLQTADDLERLEHEFKAAQGDEARAEALYQFASYQYPRSLLFYNPAAWEDGDRHDRLKELDDSGAFRHPGESRLLFDHMQKHDVASRALAIYMDVVRQFPGTRAARDALFTAAVCHDRLSRYNGYWTQIYDRGGHAGDRRVRYRNVKAAYPGYRFPVGTVGWEPASRTVNGHEAWPAPPKPKPRPSRWKRISKTVIGSAVLVTSGTMMWLSNASRSVGLFAGRMWESFSIGFQLSGLLFLLYRSGHARRLLRAELGRCQSRPRPEPPRVAVAAQPRAVNFEPSLPPTWISQYLNSEARDEWLEFFRDASYKLRQLLSYRRGASTLAFGAAAHVMAASLAVSLLGPLAMLVLIALPIAAVVGLMLLVCMRRAR